MSGLDARGGDARRCSLTGAGQPTHQLADYGVAMLIDLRKLREPLTEKMRKALVSFSKKHPDEQICTVAIWGDGFHGTAALWLNTPDSSAASVKANIDHGFAWYGEDRQGRFCNSPCDFCYSLGEFDFPRYPDFYRVEDDIPVDFITLEGTKERADPEEGDERKNQIVFPFLKAVVTDLQPFAELSRVAPFRVGVRMHDSWCEEFWLVEIEVARN